MTIDALERGMGGHSTQSSFDEDKRSGKKERGKVFRGSGMFFIVSAGPSIRPFNLRSVIRLLNALPGQVNCSPDKTEKEWRSKIFVLCGRCSNI